MNACEVCPDGMRIECITDLDTKEKRANYHQSLDELGIRGLFPCEYASFDKWFGYITAYFDDKTRYFYSRRECIGA